MKSAAIAAVLAALVMLGAGSAGVVPRASAQGETQGDVNCDSSVNAIDSLQILRHVAGLGTTAGCLATSGDVNCDVTVNSVDSLRILRYVAALSSATPDDCAPIGDALTAGPSSIELIEAALGAGDIDQEAALKYEVFSLYADSRLPAQYTGDDRDPVEGLDIVARALQGYAGFSPGTQAALDPFFKRPDEPGSWITLATVGGASAAPQGAPVITWQKFSAVGGKVQVWAQDRYPGDAAKAQTLADAMTAKIWPNLTGLMQKQPLSDDGLPNNGGTAALDIYFIHAPLDTEGNEKFLGRANFADKDSTCQEFPTYLYVDSNEPIGSETSPGILQTTSHEFFHTLQFAYKYQTGCWSPEYRWFLEASATWAEHFVYPHAQSEQVYAEDFLDHLDQTLTRLGGNHEYGAYLLPFYLQLHEPGGAAVVQRIFAAFAGGTSLNAINGQVQGGFEKVWPRFAVQNWNREPADEYKQNDSLSDGASSTKTHFGSPDEEPLSIALDPLSAYYSTYTFDDSVRKIVFNNKFADVENIHVWAIVKIGDTWKEPEDLSDRSKKEWCRDDPEEDVTELVIIVSNSHMTSSITPPEDAVVEGKAAGCNGWRGTAKLTEKIGGPDQAFSGTLNATADILWELHDQSTIMEPCTLVQDQSCLIYHPTGTITWTFEYSITTPTFHCEESSKGTVPANAVIASFDQQLELAPEDQGGFRYVGHGLDPVNLYPSECSQDFIIWYMEAPESEDYHISRGADSFSGSYHTVGSFESHTTYDFSWQFHEVGHATPLPAFR